VQAVRTRVSELSKDWANRNSTESWRPAMNEDQNNSSAGRTVRGIVRLPVDNLLLDPQNPRLAMGAGTESPSQFDLIKVLWTEMAVDELVLSIAANGYFPEEPLFVIPTSPGNDDTKYTVLEGNRRLAAVRILLDDELREKLRATKMPRIDHPDKEKLSTLPASIYENRQVLWTYLSFRHINSPQEWDAYSKAKFVARVHDEYGVSLNEISNRIGDQHETVRRLYRGYKVLSQAEEEGIYDVEERYRRQFYFSHLYTALAYSQFQEFLGMQPEDFEKEKPVPETHINKLGELLTWLYGRRTEEVEIKPKVRRQNPDLNTLREVISNPVALDALRSGYPLARSHEIGISDERRFREALIRAKEEIQHAQRSVAGYDGDEGLFQTLMDIQRVVGSLRKKMDEVRNHLVREE
jgi:hypothetical protein